MKENYDRDTLLKFTQNPGADFSEFLNISSENKIKKFGVNLHGDLESDRYQMIVSGMRDFYDIPIEYSEKLDPIRNPMLHDRLMFKHVRSFEDFENNPKVELLIEYTNNVAEEIKSGMPYDVEVYPYVDLDFLRINRIVNSD